MNSDFAFAFLLYKKGTSKTKIQGQIAILGIIATLAISEVYYENQETVHQLQMVY